MDSNAGCCVDSSEKYRLECEARAWLRMIRENGRDWWDTEKRPRLLKLRGEEGLRYLLTEMNRQTRPIDADSRRQ